MEHVYVRRQKTRRGVGRLPWQISDIILSLADRRSVPDNSNIQMRRKGNI
jgi:hypothetical protein